MIEYRVAGNGAAAGQGRGMLKAREAAVGAERGRDARLSRTPWGRASRGAAAPPYRQQHHRSDLEQATKVRPGPQRVILRSPRHLMIARSRPRAAVR
jgi:hypothetical protein